MNDDDKAIDNPSWSLRAKFMVSMISGIAATFGLLYIYMFWLTG
ncbi:hypothetical protein [Hyphococcus sp.]